MPYQTFYKQFRAGFLDNLRKQGDRLVYKNNAQLDSDEKMSPTLEAAIVLWALERIDARLPKKVKKKLWTSNGWGQLPRLLTADHFSKYW